MLEGLPVHQLMVVLFQFHLTMSVVLAALVETKELEATQFQLEKVAEL